MLKIDETGAATWSPENLLNLSFLCLRQWLTERLLLWRGIRFRTTDPNEARNAYASMTPAEFDAINGRQAWANWQVIARALNGNVPDKPLAGIDLACGTGLSTQVLSYYCPLGSEFIGYELSAPLAELAQKRHYNHRTGKATQVSFCSQDITQTWLKTDGSPVAARSIDLINASGVIGHHFTLALLLPLIVEINRVLTADGIVMLDVGPTLSEDALVEAMTKAGFKRINRYYSSWFDPNGQVVFSRAQH